MYKDSRHRCSGYSNFSPDELWLAFGTGVKFQYISSHEIVTNTDLRICATLPMFHSFTGYDTVSTFCVEAIRQHGIHGRFTLKSPKHLKSCR